MESMGGGCLVEYNENFQETDGEQLFHWQLTDDPAVDSLCGVWLVDDDLVGFLNLRGMAAATQGSFLGDYLLAAKGDAFSIDRLAHGPLRVGPSDGARGKPGPAQKALSRLVYLMKKNPTLLEELTGLQRFSGRRERDSILDQLLVPAIEHAIRACDTSLRARVENDGTGYYKPANPDDPPLEDPESRLYFTPPDVWTIGDVGRLRALLRSQTRNSVEELLIRYIEAEAAGYDRLRDDFRELVSNADDEEPLHEAAIRQVQVAHYDVSDDEELDDERGMGKCEETRAISPEGRAELAQLIEAFTATLKPLYRKIFELLKKAWPVERIVAEVGCSNVDISRLRADFRTFLMNA
jgi:hypothetical protein